MKLLNFYYLGNFFNNIPILFNNLGEHVEGVRYRRFTTSFPIEIILGMTFLVGDLGNFVNEATSSFFNLLDTLRVSIIDIIFLLCDAIIKQK